MNRLIINDRIIININDIIITNNGRCRLDYIGKQSFTIWTMLDIISRTHPFGKTIRIEDNQLSEFLNIYDI